MASTYIKQKNAARSDSSNFMEKIHSNLYENILLLTSSYPPSDEFLKVFKRNMFVHNNSPAFRQVIYYLLKILNEQELVQRITSWPVFDQRSETQFRTEVLKYVNELNKTYTYAKLPTLLMSHVISPGGIKFAKVLLQLTQLVILEHLKRGGESTHCLFYSVSKPHQYYGESISKTTSNIEKNILKIKHNFETKVQNHYKLEALRIEKDIVTLRDKVAGLKKKFETLKEQSVYKDVANRDFTEDIKNLLDTFDLLRSYRNRCNKAVSDSTILLSGELSFKYNDKIHSIPINLRNLSILEIFKHLLQLFEAKSLEVRSNFSSNEEIESATERLKEIIELQMELIKQYSQMNQAFSTLNLELNNIKTSSNKSNKLKIDFKLPLLEEEVTLQSTSPEVLAVPLDNTDESLGILILSDEEL